MDRFYPVGLPAAEDVWKTSYEAQNEQRSFERSAYPPGTSVHQPGARDMFGFSTPGPIAARLARPELALTQEVDVPNPREHHAITRVQEPDDRQTFFKHDVPEMMRSYRSPVATMTMSPGAKSMTRTRSLPALEKKPMPPRICEPDAMTAHVEDTHFDYFVPKGLQNEPRDRLHAGTLSRLKKDGRISFPFTGEGTGFRSQGDMGSSFMPPKQALARGDVAFGDAAYGTTTHRSAFTKPPFFRTSPLQQATAFRNSLA